MSDVKAIKWFRDMVSLTKDAKRIKKEAELAGYAAKTISINLWALRKMGLLPAVKNGVASKEQAASGPNVYLYGTPHRRGNRKPPMGKYSFTKARGGPVVWRGKMVANYRESGVRFVTFRVLYKHADKQAA